MSRPHAANPPPASRRRILLLGHGIAESRSPALHGPLLARRDPAPEYAILDLPEARFPDDFLAALRDPATVGFNVTVPYKTRVAVHLDRIDPSAAASLGAVNCIYRCGADADGRARFAGANTDGEGFRLALDWLDFPVRGVPCGLLGAGGAARAVARALLDAGAAELRIANRTPAHARSLARELADPRARAVDGADALAGCALLVNATPARPPEIPDAALAAARFVIDLNTTALSPALPERLAARGIAHADGAAMLHAQAALCHPLWFGEPPGAAPLDELRALYYNSVRRASPSPSAFP